MTWKYTDVSSTSKLGSFEAISRELKKKERKKKEKFLKLMDKCIWNVNVSIRLVFWPDDKHLCDGLLFVCVIMKLRFFLLWWAPRAVTTDLQLVNVMS